MREIEGRMGDQLIPNKDGDLYTKEKKRKKLGGHFFSFLFFVVNPSLQAALFFLSLSTV